MYRGSRLAATFLLLLTGAPMAAIALGVLPGAIGSGGAYAQAAAALAAAPEPAAALWPQLQAPRGPINAYFERVLVNADDPALRQARLALVQHIAALPAPVADLSRLQGF